MWTHRPPIARQRRFVWSISYFHPLFLKPTPQVGCATATVYSKLSGAFATAARRPASRNSHTQCNFHSVELLRLVGCIYYNPLIALVMFYALFYFGFSFLIFCLVMSYAFLCNHCCSRSVIDFFSQLQFIMISFLVLCPFTIQFIR